MKRALSLLLLTLVATQAQNIVTVTNYASGPNQTNQFRISNGYGPNLFSLDGTPTNAPANQQWKTTDPYDPISFEGATSQLQYMNGWTPRTAGTGNQSVLFGGYGADFFDQVLPGITNPQLYYDFSTSLTAPEVIPLGSSVSYIVDFGIIGPSSSLSPTYTNKDFFGFSLYATNGVSLASFSFNPFTATLTNGLRVQWEQNGTNVVTDGTTFKAFDIQYGSLYRMTATVQGSSINMSIAGLQTQTGVGQGITNYAVVTNQAIVTGGALSAGYSAEDFERISLDWELSSGTNTAPGANYALITAISTVSQLSVIPEPGTWAAAMLLLGGAAYAARRRQRSKSA